MKKTTPDNTVRLVLVGPPGSGKGTQASLLRERFGVPHVSSGDVLRREAEAGTEFGRQIKPYMERGEIGPVELITDIILGYCTRQCPGGFILDGFPRTRYQAERLEEISVIDAAIFIDVPEETVLLRILGRRTCGECGAVYHVETSPPERDGLCDRCGGALIRRSDDTEETLATRFRVYNEDTRPVIDFYRDRDLLTVIDGNLDYREVFDSIASIIDMN